MALPLWVAGLASHSSADPKNYVAKVFTTGAKSVNYRIFTPKDYSAQKKYPLVISMHGAGERGADNLAQLKYPWTHMWSDSAIQAKYPSFAVAPQLAAGADWDPPLLVALVRSLQKEFSLDSTRLYVMGLSMGGNATWRIITDNPLVFAAALPVCGWGTPSKASNLLKEKIWAFHGDADATIPVSQTRDMVNAIKALGGSLKYTEYPGVGHESWINAAKEPGVVDWVFSQVLGGATGIQGAETDSSGRGLDGTNRINAATSFDPGHGTIRAAWTSGPDGRLLYDFRGRILGLSRTAFPEAD